MIAPLPTLAVPPLKLPKYCGLQCSRPCAGGLLALKVTKVPLLTMFAPMPRWAVPLKLTKLILFTLFAPLPRWAVPSFELPRHDYLQCWRPCPCGLSRPQNYQSVAIHSARAPVQVGVATSRLLKYRYLLCSRLCPSGLSCPQNCQSIIFFAMVAPWSRWAVPPLESPGYRYVQWARPCPSGLSHPQGYQDIAVYNVASSNRFFSISS